MTVLSHEFLNIFNLTPASRKVYRLPLKMQPKFSSYEMRGSL
jgi:hypothetical protein